MQSISKSVEETYQEIANYIVENIYEDWSTAWIIVEATDENVYSMVGKFCMAEDVPGKSFRVNHNVAALFSELREHTAREDVGTWLKAKFTLSDSGQFELEFSY